MNTSGRRRIFFLALASVSQYAAAASFDLSLTFFQRGYWTDFDWDSAKVSDLWADPAFGAVDPSAPADSLGRRHLRHHEISVDGVTYVATLGELPRALKPDFAQLAIKDPKPGDCEHIAKVLDKHFTDQVGPYDNKWFSSPGKIGADQVDWQWQAGSTRVSLKCEKIPGDKIDLVTARFEAAIEASRIEGPINLLCDRDAMEASDPNHLWVNAQPLVFTVIPLFRVVTDAERNAIGRLDSISGTTVEVTITGKDRTLNVTISRLDGTLTGTVSSSATKVKIADLQGKCDRHDPGDRKF